MYIGIRDYASTVVIITLEADGCYTHAHAVRSVFIEVAKVFRGGGVIGSGWGVLPHYQSSARCIQDLHPAVPERRHTTMKTWVLPVLMKATG